MTIYKEIFICGCLLWTGKLVQCKPICPKNEYIIIDAPANQLSCLPCNNCPEGRGLHPPCGSTLEYSHMNIDCFDCTVNTYSDEYGPSSCKACAICSANEIVNKGCTAKKNTVCSKTCVKGYYYDTKTHDCQLCSECCGNDNGNIRIEECKRHSMPLSKQCSVHQSQHCRGRNVTTQPQPYAPTSPSSPGQTPSNPGSNKTTAWIAGFSVIAVMVLIIVIIIYILKKRRRVHVPCRDNERNDVEGGNVDAHENNGAMGLQGQLVEGQRWKLLKELPPETHGQLEDILAPEDPDGRMGNWYNLGLEYEVEKYKLDQLKTNRDCKAASRSVLEFIAADKPNLTIHDFCTTLKKIKQNEALELLKGHVVAPCEG